MMERTDFTRDDLLALNAQFREVKHAVNNTLAVIMALSELSQRNTEHYEKLANAVLTRCPDIVAQLQSFQKQLTEKIETVPQR